MTLSACTRLDAFMSAVDGERLHRSRSQGCLDASNSFSNIRPNSVHARIVLSEALPQDV